MADKIINASLFKLIKEVDFNQYKKSSVTVVDSNQDGYVTTADRFEINGERAPAFLRDGALRAVCKALAPRNTKITINTKAQPILDRNNVLVVREITTGTGHSYDDLLMKSGSFQSFGAYDASLGGCHYNKNGYQIDPGRNDHEISVDYEDATGAHRAFVDLQSGRQTPVK